MREGSLQDGLRFGMALRAGVQDAVQPQRFRMLRRHRKNSIQRLSCSTFGTITDGMCRNLQLPYGCRCETGKTRFGTVELALFGGRAGHAAVSQRR
ncbi:hypothetical protein GCM10008098_16790 [Rhodanobacter panaciterrae]|uniref:Uncharacterized protein n=1 Tax=Rhodanobacter panaciterrae TaxID=490572 RepID=A0ABQ2ZVC7_9GAMM|nr:hypothetical protein GCM10008098_16790 [Rhodanobacter panaciterrae]